MFTGAAKVNRNVGDRYKGDNMKPLRVTGFLLAIAIIGANSNAHGGEPRSEMIPVDLICPANTSNGTLEMTDQSDFGFRRTRVVYADGNPVSIEFGAQLIGGGYFIITSFKIGAEKNKTEQALSESISINANALKSGVCEGSAQAKARYYATLRANAASVRKRPLPDH